MRRVPLLTAWLGVAAMLVLAGCESTQEKSREIGAALGPVSQEKGLAIDERNDQVEVLDTTVIGDAGEAAVVVELRNNSSQTLTNVPILINVVDAKGRSLYKNDIPGIEPALASVPLLRPNQTVEWVHNQVLATGQPDSVKVTVGASDQTLAGELPEIEVGEPVLANDPVSGINARGSATNRTGELHDRLLIYGVARRDGEIVAAGRAAIEEMKPDKRLTYFIYFVGDPTGAELSVTSYPTPQTTNQED